MSQKLAKLIAFLIVVVVLTRTLYPATAQDKTFKLTVMHTNDTHSHIDPQSNGNGGVARQAAVVKAIRAEVPNSLLLDAGDRFTGTLYHKYYKGEENSKVMNALGYDAMTLGNHEFDDGGTVLSKFLSELKFPVVSTNIDASKYDELKGKWVPYTILEVGGEKIGVLALTTSETPELTLNFAGKETIVFSADYAGLVNATVKELQGQGLNKFILLTHIGYDVDTALVPKLSGIDLIVGGHSHTLLSNTLKTPYAYPAALKNADGDPIYIVQAGEKDQYLGRLDVTFNDKGVITRASGDTILLSHYITPDPEMAAMIAEMGKPIEALKKTPVTTDKGDAATTKVLLENKDCREQECALGDLIADAIRAESKAQIAITNGGGIRANLDEGVVTVGGVLTVLPFGNTMATLKLKGEDVIAALENGVSQYGQGAGRFPQVSGIRFTFDPSKEVGKRIQTVEVMGADGKFAPIDPAATYSIVTNNFMRTGGDGYAVFFDPAKAIDPYDFGRPLEEVVMDYIAANTPISPAVDGRITKK